MNLACDPACMSKKTRINSLYNISCVIQYTTAYLTKRKLKYQAILFHGFEIVSSNIYETGTYELFGKLQLQILLLCKSVTGYPKILTRSSHPNYISKSDNLDMWVL